MRPYLIREFARGNIYETPITHAIEDKNEEGETKKVAEEGGEAQEAKADGE
eukprot:CAMPEP_0202958188 /NCGR_PEP_ID=MMETSP1396-20130829/2551_1 /ASSEMBLY_ACC=CAM_ASM_000872 /TAXON_ID= /ORGANISM="Pseudokeronopsis sp., Strain Brazil" /LENGTH=50 /DNA_ID=CAMNT_0049676111 /DNA_START=691 /DNA_END=843 /DNA_ORIENTATION=-